MSTTPRRLNKYELLERLGHGGIAEVWKALDTQLQRYVAIKLLHPNLRDNPDFISRFLREAQLIASLHHPNIVQIHDFQTVHTSELQQVDHLPVKAYMVMDYVEGQTLADYIRQTSSKGLIPSAVEIVGLFTSISLAIDYAHQKGMIHRDIKPANILLDARNTIRNPMGEPILTDFGVAKLLSSTTNTMSGAQLGTPLYISPEQARGYPGNERSDLYSLGVILYEIVTGVTPFRGDSPLDVIQQHLNNLPPAPALINPNVPPTLSLVIMRNLSKDPGTRFSSAAAMTIALAEALQVPVSERLGVATYPADPLDMPTLVNTVLPVSQSGTAASDNLSLDANPFEDNAEKTIVAAKTSSRTLDSNLEAPHPEPVVQEFSQVSAVLTASAEPSTQNVQEVGSLNSVPRVEQVAVAQMAPPLSPTWPIQSPLPGLEPVARPVPQKKPRKTLYLLLSFSLLVVLIGSGLAAFLIIRSQAPAGSTVGRAFFVSSDLVRPGSAQGIADQLQIDLRNIPDPLPGKSYYAWLLGDKNPEQTEDLVGSRPFQPPLLLTNALPVKDGVVRFTFGGDAQHSNLLSVTSRFLITEEPAGQTPSAPSTDRTTWRYYAELPQTPLQGGSAGFSALTHLRHLFYQETNTRVLGLQGGLDLWLFRNTEKVLEYAISANDYWKGEDTTASDIQLMSEQFIRILNHLDGAANIHLHVPDGTPFLADPLAAKIGLLTVDPEKQVAENYATNPPGYIDHIQIHLNQIAKAPDVTPETRQLTARILDGMNRAKIWLSNVHRDALQLLQMKDKPDQLRSPEAKVLLDDLAMQATYAYIGQLDLTTNQVQSGVLQAHYDIQQLATFIIAKELPTEL